MEPHVELRSAIGLLVLTIIAISAFAAIGWCIVKDMCTPKSPMKIYRMNGADYVCARSPRDAMRVYREHLSMCFGKGSIEYNEILSESEAFELSEEKLSTMFVVDERGPEQVKRTFKEELLLKKEPDFFASSEW